MPAADTLVHGAAARRGSLSVGKDADLVVLSPDPFTLPPNEIRDTQVVLTIAGGRITFFEGA